MNLKVRIMNLVNRALAMNEQMNKSGIPDFEKWDAEQKKLSEELDAIDEAAGPGLVPGRVLSFGVADGSASYVVTKVRKNDVVVEWVPLYDSYFARDAVYLSRDKRHYLVVRDIAERHVQCEDMFRKAHGGKLAPMPTVERATIDELVES